MTDRIRCKESVNDLHEIPSYFETVPKQGIIENI